MGPAGAPAGGASPTRVLLFTGKGGVGKTTASAATAVRCAEAGLRTLALSECAELHPEPWRGGRGFACRGRGLGGGRNIK